MRTSKHCAERSRGIMPVELSHSAESRRGGWGGVRRVRRSSTPIGYRQRKCCASGSMVLCRAGPSAGRRGRDCRETARPLAASRGRERACRRRARSDGSAERVCAWRSHAAPNTGEARTRRGLRKSRCRRYALPQRSQTSGRRRSAGSLSRAKAGAREAMPRQSVIWSERSVQRARGDGALPTPAGGGRHPHLPLPVSWREGLWRGGGFRLPD